LGAPRGLWPVASLVIGIAAAAAGVALIVGYFAEAVLARVGEPDQSLLFWYLPLLFAGVAAFFGGCTAAYFGFRAVRRTRGPSA